MTLFLIIFISLTLISAVVLCWVLNKKDNDALQAVFMGLTFGLAMFTIIGAANIARDNAEDRRKSNLEECVTKGGGINGEGLCIVNGKPVQFNDGSWQK